MLSFWRFQFFLRPATPPRCRLSLSGAAQNAAQDEGTANHSSDYSPFQESTGADATADDANYAQPEQRIHVLLHSGLATADVGYSRRVLATGDSRGCVWAWEAQT